MQLNRIKDMQIEENKKSGIAEAKKNGDVFNWYTAQSYYSQKGDYSGVRKCHDSLQWCFWLEKNDFAKSYQELFWRTFPMDDQRHDFTEFHDNNLKEFEEKFMSEKMKEKVEFVMNRFSLFLRRVNKKSLAYLGYKLIENEAQAFAHYFRMQKRVLIQQEKLGADDAYKAMFVDKKYLMDNSFKILNSLESQEDRGARNALKKELIDLLLRYVYYKTTWYADIDTVYYVEISKQMLCEIEEWSDKKRQQSFSSLCLQVLLLSDGQLIVGNSTNFMLQHEMLQNPVRLSNTHMFTWIGYQKFDTQYAYMSAMVPRRIPEFEIKKITLADGSKTDIKTFKGFRLEHYAMLLTTQDESNMQDQSEKQANWSGSYNTYLPLQRLAHFEHRHIRYAAFVSYRDGNITCNNGLTEMGDQCNTYKNCFTTNNYGPMFSKDLISSGDCKKYKNRTYTMQCRFSFRFESRHSREIFYAFEPQCYSKNEEGFWTFDENLITESTFNHFVNESMPDSYVEAAKREFDRGAEVLIVQKRRYSANEYKTGYESREGAIESLQRFEKSQRLAKVLQMLPIVKMEMNSQQQKILNSTQNLFILGRSGTGKTTTTVLRFFCQEAIYLAMRKQTRLLRMHESNGHMKKYREQEKLLPRLTSDDIKESTNMKMVFVTSSPVLTNEVKQYYASLKQQLAAHLLVVEKARDELKQNGYSLDKEEEKKKDDEDKVTQDNLREKMIKLIEIKEQEILQAEQLDQQLDLPEKASLLRPMHFPLFLTVQKLVYMLDASLYSSFFSRRQDGRIIGMETSLGWHSEDRGVFMINQDFKQSNDLKKELQEFELSVLAGEKADEFEELGAADIQMDMMINDITDGNKDNFSIQNKKDVDKSAYAREGHLDSQFRKHNSNYNFHGEGKAKRKVQVEEFPLCQEVTLEMFEEKFMTRMYIFMTKSLTKRLSATFLWTEIMSVIKGSLHQGSEFYQSYLSRREYMHHANNVLSKKEKCTIYYIFLKYEEWKMNIRAFDFLDVVNHVLAQSVGGHFNGNQRGMQSYSTSFFSNTFDFLIIDEVQDLYPKTIKLLLQHAKYKVVFAGDSAQTIAKGVSSRISDMRSILTNKGIMHTEAINLSINYRSQNSILQLANNVVKLIETIFPLSIDKMTEEVSEKDGEKPFLIDAVGDDLLCQFFFGKTVREAEVIQEEFSVIEDDEDGVEGQVAKNSLNRRVITPHFGASQVIIVREQAVKQQLPEFMKSMLCLTVYESKGLEFDDVILFNFFAMGEIKSNSWKFLQHIQPETGYRKELPDWVLNIAPDEEETFVDLAVADGLAVFRSERKAQRLAEEALLKADREQNKLNEEPVVDGNDEAKIEGKIEEEEQQQPVAAQQVVPVGEEGEDQASEDEQDPEEMNFIEKLRIEKQAEFYKLKYDAAIARFQQTGEHAQFIQEFNYRIEGLQTDLGDIQRRYQMLCTELKFLYVAITRPKLRLFIYDEDTEARKPIEALWTQLGAVQRITRKQLEEEKEKRMQEAATQKASSAGSLGEAQCDQDQWKFQGLRFLKQKNYQQAIKCFQFAGAKALVLRCNAFIAAQKAQQKQSLSDSNVWSFKSTVKHMRKNAKRQTIQDMKKDRIEVCRLFHQAGVAFERAQIPKFAASCYFTARSYTRASEIFKQLEQWSQVGECLMRIGKNRYREAASFFEKGDLILRAIECYEQSKEWELLLHCLNRNQDKFGENERLSLINKYVPIALNNIYQQYGMVDKKEDIPMGDKGNLGEQVEKKIQDKYAVTDAIAEEEFDEYGQELEFKDDEDDDEGSAEEAKNDENVEAEKESSHDPAQQSDDEIGSDDDDQNLMSKGFHLETIIKQNYKLDEENDEQGDQVSDQVEQNDSFEIIDSMSEGGRSLDSREAKDKSNDVDFNTKKENLLEKMKSLGDSFDHLSQYDPDDEFLKSSRSLSIIESIVSRNGRGTSALSESSEFSIISSGNVKSLISQFSVDASINQQAMQQINFIDEQEDDNYVQDVIAQKIIYYLSLWSDDMRKQLNELKKQGILHEVPKDAKNETIDETDFIIQMDDVDQDFVNLILDTLEVYEFYHMSLMMCKRYHLSGRQGRYLVLMCSKYSNLDKKRINFAKLVKSSTQMQQQRACSLLAHEAIHNVLCLIDSNYLKMKDFGQKLEDDNSLGIQAYRTILNLGFWKKLVYILEKKISLHLCLKFFDFKNYILLMKAFVTQEEKIKNRALLDVWTLKTQIKGFLIQKQRILARQANKHQFASLIEEFTKECADTVSAVQLNQRQMQSMLLLQQKIAEFATILYKLMQRDERQAQINALKAQIDEIVAAALKPLAGKATDQQKFIGATMVFDLCFNTPNIAQFQNRILKQVVAQPSCRKTAYSLLQQAFDKLENYAPMTEFDPVLDALYSANLISHLENEDFADQEMQNLFQFYSESYMLVSVQSSIINEVILFQNLKVDYDVFTAGEARNSKLKHYFFDLKTRQNDIKSYIESNQGAKALDQWKSSERHVAFIADMDAQFLFVPKSWVRFILMVKIARIQSSLIYSDRCTEGTVVHLHSEKFLLNQKLIFKLKMMNSQQVSSIIKQAQSLTKVQVSSFWYNLGNIYKINYTAKALIEAVSIQKIIRFLAKGVLMGAEHDANYLMFGHGLFPVNQIQIKEIPNDKFSTEFSYGLDLWKEVCGERMRKIGKEKDQDEFILRLLLSLTKFINVNHYLPFLEMHRRALKLERKQGPSEDFTILKSLRNAIECHGLLQSGSWTEACTKILALSSVKPEAGKEAVFDALTLQQKTGLLEFAAIMIFLLQFKVAYLPDYALFYLDTQTDFSSLYGDNSQSDLLRQRSSLMRKKSKASQEEEKQKSSIQIIGTGKISKPVVHDCEEEDEYYEETQVYKRPDQEEYGAEEDYGEEEAKRMLIERNVEATKNVENPHKELLQPLYESLLLKLVQLIETINQDSLSFMYKLEQQRIYNLLMAVVVNDKVKTARVCQLLGQGFNRLMSGPYDDYFTELGVPSEWSNSNHASTLTKNTFKEQMDLFDQADVGLKWQWFCDLEVNESRVNFFTVATGLYVAKIDIKAGQTEQAQIAIDRNARQFQLFETRQLAVRASAGRQIVRALRRIIYKVKQNEIEEKKRVELHGLAIEKVGKASKEKLDSILAHSRVTKTQQLTQLSQVDCVSFFGLLQECYSKINFLQELMIAKVFSNSIEISKAISFMGELCNLHEQFCIRARLFAKDQADILNSFDLMEQGEDPLAPLLTDLKNQLRALESQIKLWQFQVFEGKSSGFAIKKIMESQMQVQQRMKLKWQTIKPTTKKERLGIFKEKMIKKNKK